MGLGALRRETLIAKEEEISRRQARKSLLSWIWNRVIFRSVGYGYKAENAVFFLCFIWALGAVFFRWAYHLKCITPRDKEAFEFFESSGFRRTPSYHSPFNAFVYSLDALIPLIDLHQTGSWQVNWHTGPERRVRGLRFKAASAFRAYLFIHGILGWLFVSFALLGLALAVRA